MIFIVPTILAAGAIPFLFKKKKRRNQEPPHVPYVPPPPVPQPQRDVQAVRDFIKINDKDANDILDYLF